ncbi:hypothetical protein OE88DRAFT_1432562 [Heliocybe sulcata]|uniref:Uncharacterized protein n=1 Tax=Heliocybe sulcata TaxID=5364 RepID=A0A5C3N6J8_9AGAM|nr:hypothetical protein OE88DRAFT_1432562 [Heliocybe sulcata]
MLGLLRALDGTQFFAVPDSSDTSQAIPYASSSSNGAQGPTTLSPHASHLPHLSTGSDPGSTSDKHGHPELLYASSGNQSSSSATGPALRPWEVLHPPAGIPTVSSEGVDSEISLPFAPDAAFAPNDEPDLLDNPGVPVETDRSTPDDGRELSEDDGERKDGDQGAVPDEIATAPLQASENQPVDIGGSGSGGRRSARVPTKRVRTEVMTLREQKQQRLGLYDNPEDGDQLQNQLPVDELRSDEEDIDGVDAMPVGAIDILEARRPAIHTYGDSHTHWFVRMVLILVSFLHIKYHVTFRACSLILWTMRTIFVALGHLAQNDRMPTTLTTVIQTLDFGDRFEIYPSCPVCHELFSPTTVPGSVCPDCSVGLFKKKNMIASIYEKITGRSLPPPLPEVAVPVSPLSNLLVDFLGDGDKETLCEEWLDHEPQAGRGNLFFSRASLTWEEELRIGVTFSLDWFNTNTSNYSGSHSSGVMSFCVSNLPMELRRT